MAQEFYISIVSEPETPEEVAKVADAFSRMAAGLLLDGIDVIVNMYSHDPQSCPYDHESEDEDHNHDANGEDV